jgi:DNA-binding winged helix-turn-helix (wHTH) protein
VPFQFSGYSVDVDRRELRCGAELIDIGPQVFDLLVYLIRNRDRVVSKDDLLDAVWEGRIVSESTLTSRINAARHAIGDTGADQTLIKTIARKGFRFIGEVEEGKKALPQVSAGGAEVAAGGLRQKIRFCTTSDGVRIAYAAVGKGPPLVKAANWLNHLEYDWQSPIWSHVLRAIAARCRLIRYDERGNGLSDWDVEDISLEAFVRDLESVVDANGLKRFPLLGISQGCAVSIAYTVRHPERVSQLVVPEARLAVIDGAGHMGPSTHGSVVSELIAAHIGAEATIRRRRDGRSRSAAIAGRNGSLSLAGAVS